MKKLLSIILLFSLCSSAVWAQTRTISGTVYDATDNSPLIGASVSVKGTTKGTLTDIDGKYTLSVGANEHEIVFSYMGMHTKTERIGNRTTIDVKMEPDAKVLDDVVVTALGIKREQKSLTVAQQSVDTKTLEEVRDANIVSSLAGKVSGVQVTPPQTATGSARIVIRGNSSFLGNNQPLWVVDGIPIDNSAGDADNKNASGGGLDMGNGAADLNPSDIESMQVLKGPNAAALYGSRAANGVILVTTKKGKEGKTKVSFNSNNQWTYVSQWPDFQNVFGVGHMYQMMVENENRNFFQYFNPNDPENLGKANPALSNPNAFTNNPDDPRIGLPLMTEMMKVAQGSRSNGSPMIGQKYVGLDGKIHEYSPNPYNVKDFYQTAHSSTNNVSIEGGNANNSFHVSYTNTQANDIVQNMNLVKKNSINARFFSTLYQKKENLCSNGGHCSRFFFALNLFRCGRAAGHGPDCRHE